MPGLSEPERSQGDEWSYLGARGANACEWKGGGAAEAGKQKKRATLMNEIVDNLFRDCWL